MKILIIGGTGEIGQYVTEKCLVEGNDVVVYSRGIHQQKSINVTYVRIDIMDYQELAEVMRNSFFDLIIDFTSLVPDGYKRRLELFISRCGHYVFISSIAVYGDLLLQEECREDTEISSVHWNYGYNKWRCEKILKEVFKNQEKCCYTIIRPGITYSDRFIPFFPIETHGQIEYFMGRVLKGKEILVCGEADQHFSVMHASDFANCLYMLLKDVRSRNDTFNLTSNETVTSAQVLHKIASICQINIRTVSLPIEFLYEKENRYPIYPVNMHWCISSEKAKKIIGDYKCEKECLSSIADMICSYWRNTENFVTSSFLDKGIGELVDSGKKYGIARTGMVNYVDCGENASIISMIEKYSQKNFENERNKKKLDLMCQWIKLKIQGISLMEFFQDRGIQSIAIYGMGEIGQLMYDELAMENEMFIRYAIDQSGRRYVESLPTYCLDRDLPKVDAIVITPVLITDQLEEQIYDALGECVTFVFEELLYELSRKHGVASTLWRIL